MAATQSMCFLFPRLSRGDIGTLHWASVALEVPSQMLRPLPTVNTAGVDIWVKKPITTLKLYLRLLLIFPKTRSRLGWGCGHRSISQWSRILLGISKDYFRRQHIFGWQVRFPNKASGSGSWRASVTWRTKLLRPPVAFPHYQLIPHSGNDLMWCHPEA